MFLRMRIRDITCSRCSYKLNQREEQNRDNQCRRERERRENGTSHSSSMGLMSQDSVDPLVTPGKAMLLPKRNLG